MSKKYAVTDKLILKTVSGWLLDIIKSENLDKDEIVATLELWKKYEITDDVIDEDVED